MLTAEKCRIYATQSELLGTQFQSVMALKWRLLANGLVALHSDYDSLEVAG
jgi:hypothetical protein